MWNLPMPRDHNNQQHYLLKEFRSKHDPEFLILGRWLWASYKNAIFPFPFILLNLVFLLPDMNWSMTSKINHLVINERSADRFIEYSQYSESNPCFTIFYSLFSEQGSLSGIKFNKIIIRTKVFISGNVLAQKCRFQPNKRFECWFQGNPWRQECPFQATQNLKKVWMLISR